MEPRIVQSATNLQRWEEAYCRFETQEQEQAKFRRRLLKLGAANWPRNWSILEVFCGRGNGLHAWGQLGFTRLEGLDLSADLARQYTGKARIHVADARQLPFPDTSRDVLCVQGGLHHLPGLADLDRTLHQMHRVLRPEGRVVIVEPWRTPFLDAAHFACNRRLLRRCWNKLDALATMTELERDTYEAWLGQPDEILATVHRYFKPLLQRIAWGKLMLVGIPRGVVRATAPQAA